jgi:hypothetical protein
VKAIRVGLNTFKKIGLQLKGHLYNQLLIAKTNHLFNADDAYFHVRSIHYTKTHLDRDLLILPAGTLL